MNSRERQFQAATVFAALLSLVYVVVTFSLINPYTLALLALLTFIAEWGAFRLSNGGSVSLSFSVILAAVLVGGPLTGAIVAAAGAVTPQEWRERKPALSVMFNFGQMAFTGMLAGLTQHALGIEPLLLSSSPHSWHWLLGAGAVGIVLAGSNMILVGASLSLGTGLSLREIWTDVFKSYAPGLVVLALLGIVLAQLLDIAGVAGMLLLAVPFAVARQTFEVYQRLNSAYGDTVRALVATIEAKDPYTRGHSERVARLARAAAENLDFSTADCQRIEWAALLHDVGKVAVSTSTLRKAGALTSEEYSSIREHPRLAAEILADIELMEDVVPLVRAHHERLDGSGYPDGLAGDELSMAAQLLAAADCLDAMTSDRAYRDALDFSHAEGEMRRMAGNELDGRCIEAVLSSARSESGTAGSDRR